MQVIFCTFGGSDGRPPPLIFIKEIYGTSLKKVERQGNVYFISGSIG